MLPTPFLPSPIIVSFKHFMASTVPTIAVLFSLNGVFLLPVQEVFEYRADVGLADDYDYAVVLPVYVDGDSLEQGD